MYQCCIFDLDGTLINSLRSIEYTVNMTLKRFGLGSIDEEQVKMFVGDGYQKLVERALAYCGDTELHCAQEAFIEYRKNFERYSLFELQAYDGIKEMLEFLKIQGIKIAVLSNKLHEQTVQNVEAVFGKGYFDQIHGERRGVKIKPDPEGVEIIMEQLEMTANQCLYFGDTSTDMKTGLAAGVDIVGVTWGFRDKQELLEFHPNYLINHPSEVKSKILLLG